MVEWRRKDFEDCGFVYEGTLIETLHSFNYEGDVLKYQIMIDEEVGQVSVSGDTAIPFCAESLYEIYARFQIVKFKNSTEAQGSRFLFEFYDSTEPSDEALRLQIFGRQFDRELVVWPYVKGRFQAC